MPFRAWINNWTQNVLYTSLRDSISSFQPSVFITSPQISLLCVINLIASHFSLEQERFSATARICAAFVVLRKIARSNRFSQRAFKWSRSYLPTVIIIDIVSSRGRNFLTCPGQHCLEHFWTDVRDFYSVRTFSIIYRSGHVCLVYICIACMKVVTRVYACYNYVNWHMKVENHTTINDFTNKLRKGEN